MMMFRLEGNFSGTATSQSRVLADGPLFSEVPQGTEGTFKLTLPLATSFPVMELSTPSVAARLASL